MFRIDLGEERGRVLARDPEISNLQQGYKKRFGIQQGMGHGVSIHRLFVRRGAEASCGKEMCSGSIRRTRFRSLLPSTQKYITNA
jgi:hypothetical protein